MQSEPFVLSGSSGRAWLLPIVGVAAAAATAFVYAWINVYSPIGGCRSCSSRCSRPARCCPWPTPAAG